MKFISQHIYDLISRFRNDVYLEDISSGTIASGGNLGLDSNNKIVKANEASGGISFDGSTANGVLTYKDADEASVESTLTYNNETLTIGESDTGSATISRNTSNDIGGQLNITAGSATGTDKAGGDIHLFGGASTGVAAGGSLKFSSSVSDGSSDATGNTRTEKFEVTSEGNVSMKGTIIGNSGSDNDLQIATDGSMLFTIDRDNDETSQAFAWENFSTEIMNLDESGNLQIDGNLTTGSTHAINSSGLIQVANQSNITGVGTLASGNATAIVDAASDTAAGKVELATTAEADTGTDTARAVTPAGLKSHVDARYHYQYIALTANATTPSDGDWMYASGNGISNHLYNQNGAAGGTTASNTDGSASTITIDKNAISGGIMIPYDCTLVGFYAQSRSNANKQQAVGIFTGQPIWNDYTNITAYLRGYSAQDISAGPDTSYSVRAVRHEVLNVNYSLSAGEALWFCIKDLSGSGGGCIVSATLVLKTLNP